MTVKEFAEALGFEVISMPSPDRIVEGAYVGDLLSWVMGRAESGNVWITIMSNINIVAVATLADISCIVLAEDVSPDKDALDIAPKKGVNILRSPLSSYETAARVSGILS